MAFPAQVNKIGRGHTTSPDFLPPLFLPLDGSRSSEHELKTPQNLSWIEG